MGRKPRDFRLSGVIADAITPYHPKNREPDYSAALDLVDFLASAGVDGICLFGATGEFINYSIPERHRLLSLCAKRSRVPVIAGVSHSTLSGALQLADDAMSAGVDALLLMPPWFYRYEQAEILEFCLQFARETSDALPIILSHNPAFSNGIAPETLRRALETGRFSGIEDASDDEGCFDKLLALKQEIPFALFGGAFSSPARWLSAGGSGVISGCACAVPELVVAISRAMHAGDPALATELSTRFAEFAQRVSRFAWPVAIKRAMEVRGQKAGPLGVPLSATTTKELDEFADWFRAWETA